MRRRKNEIAKGYIFASILHNISETHSKWTNDLFHRMRHEGFVSHVRTKNRRMLHIYSIAVRPDKNDMAIEPEGMDRKEKGKGRLVKEGGEEILQMEQILNVKLKPLILLRLLSFSPLFLQPPKNPLYSFLPSIQPFALLFLYYFHPPDKITHFLPSYLFCKVLSHSSSMANRYTSTPFLPYSLLLTPASSIL